MAIKKSRLKALVGKHVYILTHQGQMVEGILHKVGIDKVYLRTNAVKPVTTSAFFPFFNPVTPLVLFDLLAIEESPFFFGRRFPVFF